MSNFLIKLKLIYLRFLFVSVGVILIYSALSWLLIHRYSVFDLNEMVTNLGLPACLSAIAVYIWLWPRIKIMPLKTKRDNGQFFYAVMAAVAITIPNFLLQEYMQVASGKLTAINVISQIYSEPITKYYTVKKHFIDKKHFAVYRRSEVSGRNSENLTFYLYVACPILDAAPQTAADTSFKIPAAWLGIHYSKGISNYKSDEEKQAAYMDLAQESESNFIKTNFDEFVYLDHIRNNDNRKGYYAAIGSKYQIKEDELFVLEAQNEPFEARLDGKLGWVFKSFGIGAGIWLLMLIFPGVDQKQIKKLPEYGLINQWLRFKNFIGSIKINRGTPVWAILIGLNVLVYIIMVCAGLGFISFDGRDLYAWGANFRPAVIDGQWWRLLTSIFLHGGLMHLLFNMYGLFFAAIFLEPLVGKLKFTTVYVLCGVIASVTSVLWHPETLSIGASGAIFGLYGALTALILLNKADQRAKKFLLINNGIFIGINLLMGIRGSIDNAAHIGGLVSGFLIGLSISFFLKPTPVKRRYKKRRKIDQPENDKLI